MKKTLLFILMCFNAIIFTNEALCLPYQVVYTFGFVEVKRNGSEIWEQVNNNQILLNNDLVRIPPDGILRIKEPNGDYSNIPAGQENRMKDIIRLKKSKSENLTNYTSGLPTDREAKIKPKRDNTNKASSLPAFSDEVISQKIIISDNIKAFVSKAKKETEKSDYTSENLAIAYNLFSKIKSSNISKIDNPKSIQSSDQTLMKNQGSDIDYAILYCAMLRSANIQSEVKLIGNKVYVIFDTGLNPKKSLCLTANSALYFCNESIWVPLRINASDSNFLSAWYNGRKIRQKVTNSIEKG